MNNYTLLKMSSTLIPIQAKNFSNQRLDEAEYEGQQFLNCDFTNARLNGVEFIDCVFENCNFSNATFDAAALKNCLFQECKLMGVSFSVIRDFGFEIHMKQCNLSYASFDKKKVYKSSFEQCNMEGVNFTQADLSKCKMVHCNLQEALFSNTNLSGVDFRTNTNFIIHPAANNIKKARFQSHDLYRLLTAYAIVID